jgi:hypothetical protein
MKAFQIIIDERKEDEDLEAEHKELKEQSEKKE